MLAGALPSPALCLITDENRSLEANERHVALALDAGCRWIQLRHRIAETRDFFDSAERLRTLCTRFGATLIVNDRIDVAVAVGADGVHLPAAGLAPALARQLLGDEKLIGRSVHSIDEIESLIDTSIDYFQFGPVFDTASKHPFGPPQGLARLAAARAAAGAKTLVAVGGITADAIERVVTAGAAAISVIGAIHAADDVVAATNLLLSRLAK